MERLVDGESGRHNGGWPSGAPAAHGPQTATHLNPYTQRPLRCEGTLHPRWLPELARVATAEFCSAARIAALRTARYPAPIVEHRSNRPISASSNASLR